MKTDRGWKEAVIPIMRWSARILGVIIVGFSLLMFIGQSLQSGPPGKETEPIAVIGLALVGVYMIAMLLALKWERRGALLGRQPSGGSISYCSWDCSPETFRAASVPQAS